MDGSCARSRQYKLKKYLEQFRGTTIRGHDHLGARRAGPAFSDEDIRRLPDYARELVEEYAYIDGRGDHILCWDHARFYNHSCDANCLGATTFRWRCATSQPERS